MSILTFIKRHQVVSYFVLTFTISWSLVLALISAYGIPTTKDQINALLPVCIVAMLGGPSIASIFLIGITQGKRGLGDLVVRLCVWRVSIWWYVVALFIPPVVFMTVLFGLSRISPTYIPGIFVTQDKMTSIIMGIIASLVVGFFEELGWTGFAIPRLRLRYSIVTTGLIVGVLWGAWHILTNDVWASGTSAGSLPLLLFLIVSGLGFLIGQLPAYRILMVWVYDRTGSLLLTMLMHASLTASTLILGPVGISGGALFIYGFTLAGVMWVIAGVVVLINSRQFTRSPLKKRMV